MSLRWTSYVAPKSPKGAQVCYKVSLCDSFPNCQLSVIAGGLVVIVFWFYCCFVRNNDRRLNEWVDGCADTACSTSSAAEAMWRDVLSADHAVVPRVVVNLCNSRQAAAAVSASRHAHHSQLAGVPQLRQALAILCWVLGLPGQCWADFNRLVLLLHWTHCFLILNQFHWLWLCDLWVWFGLKYFLKWFRQWYERYEFATNLLR